MNKLSSISSELKKDKSLLMTQKNIETVLKNTIKNYPAGSPEVMKAKLSKEGGKCPDCGKAWEKIKINTLFQNYSIYEGCQCWDKKIEQKKINTEHAHIFERALIPGRFLNAKIANMDRVNITPETKKTIERIEAYIKQKEWVEKGICIFGSVGTGKTHMAIAVMKYMLLKGLTGIFFTAGTLNAKMLSKEHDFIIQSDYYDIIMIDDIDKIKFTEYVKTKFFEMVNNFYNQQKKIIITGNIKPEEFISRAGAATVSRLRELCLFVPISGKDYRAKGGIK